MGILQLLVMINHFKDNYSIIESKFFDKLTPHSSLVSISQSQSLVHPQSQSQSLGHPLLMLLLSFQG